MKRFLFSLFWLGLFCVGNACSKDQTYPARDLTFILQSAPGGASDFAAHTLSAVAEKELGQRIDIVYKPGASGAIGMGALANAKPDGYTIGWVAGELSLLEDLKIAKLHPDNFTAIALVLKVPAVLAVRADSPVLSLGDLVKQADAIGRPVTVANSGAGSVWYLAAKSFEMASGAKFTHVPYEGGGPAKVALLGGHVDVAAVSLGEVLVESKAGQVRILGVMSEKRLDIAPDVPTLREQGHDIVIGSWLGLAAPRGLPENIRDRLEQAYKNAFDDPKVIKSYADRGYVHEYLDAKAFEKFMSEQKALLSSLIKRVQ